MANFADVGGWRELAATAERVDIEAAAPRVAGKYGERLRRALALEIAIDALDALLVKLVVLAEGDDVAQQSCTVDRPAAIADDQHAPIRLAGDQAIRFEQVRVERFFDDGCVGGAQQPWRGFVSVDGNIEIVQQLAVRVGDDCLRSLAKRLQIDIDSASGGGREVAGERSRDGVNIGERRLVERVQIELERLRFDQVRAVGGHAKTADGDDGLAFFVQPGKLVGVPDVFSDKRQGGRIDGDFAALDLAGTGEKQLRCVLVTVVRRLAERRERAGVSVCSHGRILPVNAHA